MKKRMLSILLCLCLCVGLLPTGAFAAEEPPKGAGVIPDQEVSGPCDATNVFTFDINALSGDKIVGSPKAIIGGNEANSVIKSSTITAGTGSQRLKLTSRTFDEPRSGYIKVEVKLKQAGETYFYVHVVLTGKYRVHISGVTAMDAIYDDSPKAGYIGTPVGTLTSGEAYTGNDIEVTYTDAEGNPLTEAPTEIGSYNVNFVVPDTNETYKGSLTLPFRIIDPADAEASYQAEAGGEWFNTTFTEALANVYAGGTVKLLRDISIDGSTVLLDKAMTITSADSETPCVITTKTDGHSYLFRIGADVELKDVIVDGGSASGLTASRALIAVGDTAGLSGKLTLSTGSVVRNNNNTTRNGAGGGVCVINGECVIDGGRITGNSANSGGGLAMTGTDNLSATLISGSVDNNKATGYGGGVYINGGSFTMTKGDIYDNTAALCGGAVYAANATVELRDGTVTGNSAAYGGAMYINPSVIFELTGGSITGNTATTGYAGGIELAPEATVKISGSPVVKGNTSPEETDGGMYFDYDGSGRREPPAITIGEMTAGAELHWYTWMQENLGEMDGKRLLIATPAEGREAITDYDLSKQYYNSEDYDLILIDGSMYLVARIPANNITVSRETLSMKVGESGTLTATLTPEDTTCPVRWTSSDESVATVDNGVVTALKAGTVTITATAGDVSAFCEVTVMEESAPVIPPFIPPLIPPVIKPVAPVTPPAHICPSEAFSDVDTKQWYHEAIDYVLENELMNGMGDGIFAPATNLSRAMIVQVLYNMEGRPEVDTVYGFTDVASDAWYADAINWAAANGIVNGYGDTFGPNDPITREQMAAILYRYADYKGIDVTARGELSIFKDGEETSSWASDAMRWAIKVGLISGKGDGILDPTGTATRAEVAQILMNYCKKVLGE